MRSVFGVERVGEGTLDLLEIVVEINMGDVVFLEQRNVIVDEQGVGAVLAVAIGEVFGIDNRLRRGEDEEEVGAMLLQGVHQPQGEFSVLTCYGLEAIDAAVFVLDALARQVVDIHFGEQLAVFALNDIVIVEYSEARVANLVVVADEKLAKACVTLGVFGEVSLIATVEIVVEIQLDDFFFGHHTLQRLHLHEMRQALQGDE